MINFDLMFSEYMQDWIENNSDLTADEMEEKAIELYEQWKELPYEELGGISVKQYFENITSPSVAIDMLVEETKNGSPSSLLLDRIVELGCETQLKELIVADNISEVKIQAINLLLEMGASHPIEKYIEIIAKKDSDEGLKELCVETLATMPNEVSSYLFALIPYADYELKGLIAEILVGAEKDERTYALLEDLFKNGNNVSLYAGFIGKYGDERAMEYLYKALDNCNYADFIEIRSAIEDLGGTVDDEFRDFSSDPYYKALKNIK